MTGIRFNIRQRRFKNNKKRGRVGPDANHASVSARGTAGVASPSAALVACIPCPAPVVDGDRKISALNYSLCEAFGVRAGFFHIGEAIADFVRRMSLSGSPGLLVIGDLLNNDSIHKNTKIVSRNGTVYDARACQTADNRTLITLVNAPAQSDANLDKIARNIVENLPGAVLSLVRQPDGRLQCGYASPLSQGLFGRGMDELTSPRADFRDLIADEHRWAFDDAFRCGTDTTASIKLEIRVKKHGQRACAGPLLWRRVTGRRRYGHLRYPHARRRGPTACCRRPAQIAGPPGPSNRQHPFHDQRQGRS